MKEYAVYVAWKMHNETVTETEEMVNIEPKDNEQDTTDDGDDN